MHAYEFIHSVTYAEIKRYTFKIKKKFIIKLLCAITECALKLLTSLIESTAGVKHCTTHQNTDADTKENLATNGKTTATTITIQKQC